MIWSRREFLSTVITATGSLCVSLDSTAKELLPKPESLVPRIYEIQAFASNPKLEGGRRSLLRLARPDGTDVLVAALGDRVTYRWIATPGSELVGPLVNLSSCDLDVVMSMSVGDHRYCVDRTGIYNYDAKIGARARRRRVHRLDG